jgi:hypothetical protein
MKECTVGFARLDMTPPLGVHLGGYFNVRIADGVLDPLYVNAVAFGEGEKKAVLIVCDLLSIYGNAAHEWPVQIAESWACPGRQSLPATPTATLPLWWMALATPATPSMTLGCCAACATRLKWPWMT